MGNELNNSLFSYMCVGAFLFRLSSGSGRSQGILLPLIIITWYCQIFVKDLGMARFGRPGAMLGTLVVVALLLLSGTSSVRAQESCGNGICDPGESPSNCPEGCGLCGNGV